MPPGPLTYKDAGVDIDAGNALVEKIKPMVNSTRRPEVLAGIGGFGGLFALAAERYEEPVLVSGTDGVGTKLLLAQRYGRHSTIGIDLVAMCVNDVLVQGAEPLFFLDYFACGRLDPEEAAVVIGGIADGCRQAGAALIGGETAEMPDMYEDGEYDLAGFCVGVVERSKLIDGSRVEAGNAIVALPSSGPHSNGYSLIRRVLERAAESRIDGAPAVDLLLEPTRIYVRPVLELLRHVDVRGLAHITGGGLTDNLPRTIPPGCHARLDVSSWRLPAVFDWLQSAGGIETGEMRRTFNCGIGMAIIVPEPEVDEALALLRHAGEMAWIAGSVEAGTGPVRYD